jgi:hypothetical protein
MDEIDDIFEENSSNVKEYNLFEVPLLFIYNNETTGTFAEFELEDVDPDISVCDAIDIFMQRVMKFGKTDAKPLPAELLKSLSDDEIDLFMLAHIKEYYYEKIKEMIYIQKAESYYYDKYGFIYYVAGVGIKDAILWHEQNEKLIILHTTPEQIRYQGGKLHVTRNDSI